MSPLGKTSAAKLSDPTRLSQRLREKGEDTIARRSIRLSLCALEGDSETEDDWVHHTNPSHPKVCAGEMFDLGKVN